MGPTDSAFTESVEYIQEQRIEKMLADIGAKELLWPTVATDDLRWAISDAEDKETEFFKAFKA